MEVPTTDVSAISLLCQSPVVRFSLDGASRAGSVRGPGPRTAETGPSTRLERKARWAPGQGPGVGTPAESSPDGEARWTGCGHRYPPARAPGPGAAKQAGWGAAPEGVYEPVDTPPA